MMRFKFHASAFFLAAVSWAVCCALLSAARAQIIGHRLILKDGSYQSITKYEIHGDRIRYFSAERGEWEEVPKALVDWEATAKFEEGHREGKPAPEAVELDKELEAERQAEQARSPEVAPGLRLPDESGIFLLDTFENQPQLAELEQSGGDLDKNTKANILHTVINPLAGAKETIELVGAHAKIQAHTSTPSLYLNVDSGQGAPAIAGSGEAAPLAPSERFKIIRVQSKGGKRTAGAIQITVTGKMKADERLVATTCTAITGGWIKLAPTEPLAEGEYAVAEMLGKDGMNLYVWDFGVNPRAPANAFSWKPVAEAKPSPQQPEELKQREKQ